MNRSTWKSFERRVAKALGGRRIPVTGIDRDGADVVTPLFHVQVKRGRRMPSYLSAWLSGICMTAQDDGKIGIVVWQAKGAQDREATVLMKFSDFRDLHGSPAVEDAPGGEKNKTDTRTGEPVTLPSGRATAPTDTKGE